MNENISNFDTMIFISEKNTVETTHADNFHNLVICLTGRKIFYILREFPDDYPPTRTYIPITPKTHPGCFDKYELTEGLGLTIPSRVYHYVEGYPGTITISLQGLP